MQRSAGRFLDSLHNRVYLLSCTLDTIPLWSSFQVESRWSRPAGSSRVGHPPSLGHRFSAARLKSNPNRPPCCSSSISAPLQFLHGSANLFQLHHLVARLDRVFGQVQLNHSDVAQKVPSTSTALDLCSLAIRRSWPDTWPPVLRTAVSRH